MKRSTTNKLNMYQSVYAVITNYQAAWQDVPAMVNSITKFSSKLNLLSTRLVEQSSVTTGVSTEKQIRKDELRERMLIAEKALMLHGLATDNILLQYRNSRSKSYLFALNTNKLVVRCSELKTDLDAFGDQLGDYGIDSTLAELIPLLVTVEELKNSTWQAILKRKAATQSINELEHTIDKLLRIELDNLMLTFKIGQSAFFKAFHHARMVVDLHYGHGSKPQVEPDDGSDV